MCTWLWTVQPIYDSSFSDCCFVFFKLSSNSQDSKKIGKKSLFVAKIHHPPIFFIILRLLKSDLKTLLEGSWSPVWKPLANSILSSSSVDYHDFLWGVAFTSSITFSSWSWMITVLCIVGAGCLVVDNSGGWRLTSPISDSSLELVQIKMLLDGSCVVFPVWMFPGLVSVFADEFVCAWV